MAVAHAHTLCRATYVRSLLKSPQPHTCVLQQAAFQGDFERQRPIKRGLRVKNLITAEIYPSIPMFVQHWG